MFFFLSSVTQYLNRDNRENEDFVIQNILHDFGSNTSHPYLTEVMVVSYSNKQKQVFGCVIDHVELSEMLLCINSTACCCVCI